MALFFASNMIVGKTLEFEIWRTLTFARKLCSIYLDINTSTTAKKKKEYHLISNDALFPFCIFSEVQIVHYKFCLSPFSKTQYFGLLSIYFYSKSRVCMSRAKGGFIFILVYLRIWYAYFLPYWYYEG